MDKPCPSIPVGEHEILKIFLNSLREMRSLCV